jgi:hypothetical protein
MKILPYVFALVLAAACGGNPIKEAVSEQLRLYPETRAQDIYKSFCQDNLGPGHLIPNPDYAKAYLLEELQTYREDLDSMRYEKPEVCYVPVGDNGNFVRVDLSVVLDSLITTETLLDAFVRSANEGNISSENEWKEKWAAVEEVLRKDFQDIPDLNMDLAAIDSLIAEGHLILHHSEVFEKTYHPHYRIVAKDIFEKVLEHDISD